MSWRLCESLDASMIPSLLSLPKELRLEIFGHLVPSHTNITLRPAWETSSTVPSHGRHRLPASMRAVPVSYPSPDATGKKWIVEFGKDRVIAKHISLSPFLVCTMMHQDVCDLLYRSNTFTFKIGLEDFGWATHPPEGTYRNLPYERVRRDPGSGLRNRVCFSSFALKDITQVTIAAKEDLANKLRYNLVKQWMRELAKRLGELRRLRRLVVTLAYGAHYALEMGRWNFVPYPVLCSESSTAYIRPYDSTEIETIAASFQYCLEPLQALRGVPVVEIKGHVTASFARQLAAIVQCDVHDQSVVPRRAYKEGGLRRNVSKPRRQHGYASSRFFYEPEFEWDAIAEEDAPDDRFEPVRSCRMHEQQCLCNFLPSALLVWQDTFTRSE